MDKRAQNATDSRYGVDALLTGQNLRRELSKEYDELNAAMTKVAAASEYFRELNSILAALREELENR